MGQIFGWRVTDIYVVGTAARTITWIYNLILDFIVIAAFVKYMPQALQYWRRFRSNEREGRPS